MISAFHVPMSILSVCPRVSVYSIPSIVPFRPVGSCSARGFSKKRVFIKVHSTGEDRNIVKSFHHPISSPISTQENFP